MGLTIVKHLVELHGGTVQAHSDGENQGSTFTVELPLLPKIITRADLNSSDDTRLGGNGTHKTLAPPPLENTRILLVDDDEDALDLMRMLLRTQGAEVVGVADAGAALRELENARFDLLISDLGMPETDGYDLIKKVRQTLDERALPAIALTGYVSSEDRAGVLAAGFQMHLAKPVELEILTHVVLDLTKNPVEAD